MSKKIQKLIVLYLSKEASMSDLDELSTLVKETKNKEEFVNYIKVNHAVDFNMKEFDKKGSKKILLDYIEHDKKVLKKKKTFNIFKYAASVVVLIGTLYFIQLSYFNGSQENNSENSNQVVSSEVQIPSGSDKAILTLGDGSTIALEKGKKIQTNNAESNGQELTYVNSNKSTTAPVYNYITIPRGGQFHIKLADGTLVWLNSDSQLKYPVAFTEGETRKVELLYGEAYFDVSPSTEHKGATFNVINQDQEIEVLGTEFNLKAYKDEANIYTTLVEGKIALHTKNGERVLNPNQQSRLDLKDNSLAVKKVDVSAEISWVKGIFKFKDKSLIDIAMVISRWYDVDIVFVNPELEDLSFNGVFNKDEPLEAILESIILTKSIKSYDIKNKKITIE